MTTVVAEIPRAADTEDGWGVFEVNAVVPGAYVVRVTQTGRQTAHVELTLAAAESRTVDAPVGGPGSAVAFELPSGLVLTRRANVTVQKVGTGLVGDRQTISADVLEREWRFGGLSPGRYLLQRWDVRHAIVVDVPPTDAPQIALPEPAALTATAATGSLRVRLLKAESDAAAESISTIALARGEWPSPPIGVWMQCAYHPAAFEGLSPGRYTLLLFDGLAREQLGWKDGFRATVVDVGAAADSIELRIDE